MVDLTGFFTLGSIFTAHVTGNLVLAAAAAVHGGPWNLAQALAIPVFILAVAAAWLIARASNLHGVALTRLLLLIQLLLLVAVLVFSVTTKPSAMAGIAVMIAVCAMAIQYALLRLALPKAVSTAVMTGNLTNTVLSLMDMLSPQQALMPADRERLKSSLRLLIGFLVGCIVAAAAISVLGDWRGRSQQCSRLSRSRCDSVSMCWIHINARRRRSRLQRHPEFSSGKNRNNKPRLSQLRRTLCSDQFNPVLDGVEAALGLTCGG